MSHLPRESDIFQIRRERTEIERWRWFRADERVKLGRHPAKSACICAKHGHEIQRSQKVILDFQYAAVINAWMEESDRINGLEKRFSLMNRNYGPISLTPPNKVTPTSIKKLK